MEIGFEMPAEVAERLSPVLGLKNFTYIYANLTQNKTHYRMKTLGLCLSSCSFLDIISFILVLQLGMV